MNTLYFPLDYNHVIKLISSEEGFVVPQSYFNFPGFHLTIVIKNLTTNQDKSKLNIHLTNDKTKEKTSIYYKEFDNIEIKKYFDEKTQLLHTKMLEHLKYVTKNQIKLNENMICINCLLKKIYINNIDFTNKENMKNFYKFIESNFESIKCSKIEFPICEEAKHTIIYDINENTAYYKIFGLLVEFSYTDILIQDLSSVFKKEYSIIKKELNQIKKKYVKIKKLNLY